MLLMGLGLLSRPIHTRGNVLLLLVTCMAGMSTMRAMHPEMASYEQDDYAGIPDRAPRHIENEDRYES